MGQRSEFEFASFGRAREKRRIWWPKIKNSGNLKKSNFYDRSQLCRVYCAWSWNNHIWILNDHNIFGDKLSNHTELLLLLLLLTTFLFDRWRWRKCEVIDVLEMNIFCELLYDRHEILEIRQSSPGRADHWPDQRTSIHRQATRSKIGNYLLVSLSFKLISQSWVGGGVR